MATNKLKVGRKVGILRRPTNFTQGIIHAVRETGRGVWYDVRVAGTPKAPELASYRAADLSPR